MLLGSGFKYIYEKTQNKNYNLSLIVSFVCLPFLSSVRLRKVAVSHLSNIHKSGFVSHLIGVCEEIYSVLSKII